MSKLKLKFYGYKKCGTCRKAETYLQKRGHEIEFIDIIQNPPSKQELKSVLEKSKLEFKKLFNTSGELYREMKIKDKLGTMTEDKALDLLAKNGKLIKRPIVSDGNKKVAVGFQEEVYSQIW